jgi:hypothetical protein
MKTKEFRIKRNFSEVPHHHGIRWFLGNFLVYLGVLTIGLAIVWLIYKAERTYTSYQSATQQLIALEVFVSADKSDLSAVDVAQAERSLTTAAAALETLDQDLAPLLHLSPYLGWVPHYGPDLQALPHLLTAGRNTGQAGLVLIESLSPALAPIEYNLVHLVSSLSQADKELEQAEALLSQAQAQLDAVDLNAISPGLARRPARLKQRLPQLVTGAQLARGLPALLGATSPQTYLILTQNADELRPSGGYINAAGHIVIDRGQIVELVMQDSYAIDRLSDAYPYPPQPLYQYMAADYWVLRDAGWSPDFPTTARTAIELYALGQGVQATGVIALDQYALPALLQAVGPLKVEDQSVTGRNVVELLRQHWAPGEEKSFREWWPQRKSFGVALLYAIKQKFEQDSASIKLPVLAKALERTLAEKHMLIYLEDPAWNEFLTHENWAGALAAASRDYLMVVEANVGFNKASAKVDRQLTYQVVLETDGSATARATMQYQHSAPKRVDHCSQEPRYNPVYELNMDRCYWNYQRLIVPAGARLISGPRHIVPGQYLLRGRPTNGEIEVAPVGSDKKSWGQLVLLAPQDDLSLDYHYRLPTGTATYAEDQWVYRLFLQKQAGTLSLPVEVTINLPEGASLLTSQPSPHSHLDSMVNYQLDLQTDLAISLSYSSP